MGERLQGVGFLIWDRDSKFSGPLTEVFRTEDVKIIKTPIRAPMANADFTSEQAARMEPEIQFLLERESEDRSVEIRPGIARRGLLRLREMARWCAAHEDKSRSDFDEYLSSRRSFPARLAEGQRDER